MGCGCGGSKGVVAPVLGDNGQPLVRLPGEILPGSTWNGPQPKKPS